MPEGKCATFQQRSYAQIAMTRLNKTMFPFFRTNTNTQKSNVSLVDTHAHILPGIDDGATSMTEAIFMIEQLKNMGYKQVTATPHVFFEYYPNSKESILKVAEKVQAELVERAIDIEFNVAAEYYLDEHFRELLQDNQVLTLLGNCLLVEMSTIGPTNNTEELIWQIKANGYCPILAHPERYLYLQPEDYQRLLSYGCKFQINILSMCGYYGRQVQKRVFQLLKNKQVHFIGTDLHKPAQIEKVRKVIQSSFFESISTEIKNPKWILHL